MTPSSFRLRICPCRVLPGALVEEPLAHLRVAVERREVLHGDPVRIELVGLRFFMAVFVLVVDQILNLALLTFSRILYRVGLRYYELID